MQIAIRIHTILESHLKETNQIEEINIVYTQSLWKNYNIKKTKDSYHLQIDGEI